MSIKGGLATYQVIRSSTFKGHRIPPRIVVFIPPRRVRDHEGGIAPRERIRGDEVPGLRVIPAGFVVVEVGRRVEFLAREGVWRALRAIRQIQGLFPIRFIIQNLHHLAILIGHQGSTGEMIVGVPAPCAAFVEGVGGDPLSIRVHIVHGPIRPHLHSVDHIDRGLGGGGLKNFKERRNLFYPIFF